MSEKTCGDCKFAVFDDFGYSNYTREGTEFSCLKKAHPEGTFDRWYGEDERLKFAQQCDSFAAGYPVEMDVEREDHDRSKPLSTTYGADEEVKMLLDKWEKGL